PTATTIAATSAPNRTMRRIKMLLLPFGIAGKPPGHGDRAALPRRADPRTGHPTAQPSEGLRRRRRQHPGESTSSSAARLTPEGAARGIERCVVHEARLLHAMR